MHPDQPQATWGKLKTGGWWARCGDHETQALTLAGAAAVLATKVHDEALERLVAAETREPVRA